MVLLSVDPECHQVLPFLRLQQDLGFSIEIELVLEGGEETLHNSVDSSATLAEILLLIKCPLVLLFKPYFVQTLQICLDQKLLHLN